MLDGQTIFITASLGIARAPRDGRSATQLFCRADVAMYRSKANTPGRVMLYTADMSQRGRELIEMETDLRHALAMEQFFVLYQPKVAASTWLLWLGPALLLLVGAGVVVAIVRKRKPQASPADDGQEW